MSWLSAVVLLGTCQPLWALTCENAFRPNHSIAKLGSLQRPFVSHRFSFKSIDIQVFTRPGDPLTSNVLNGVQAIAQAAEVLEVESISYPKEFSVIVDKGTQGELAGATAIALAPDSKVTTALHEFFHSVLNSRLAKINTRFRDLMATLDPGHMVDMNSLQHILKGNDRRERVFIEALIGGTAQGRYQARRLRDRAHAALGKIQTGLGFKSSPEIEKSLLYHEVIADLGPAILTGRFDLEVEADKPYTQHRSFDPMPLEIDQSWTPSAGTSVHYQSRPIRRALGELLASGRNRSPWQVFKIALEATVAELTARLEHQHESLAPEAINELFLQRLKAAASSADR